MSVTANGNVQLTDSGTLIPNRQGITIISGTVDASSLNTTGGQVAIVGDRVGLIDATIDASGVSGGGNILIGGDYQGSGTIPNAQVSYVDKNSLIQANALESGDGGRVIVWADGATGFYGSVEARGGSQAGNGGFVEISGKENLGFAGTLLLDPENITIVDGAGGADDAELTDNGEIQQGDRPGESFTSFQFPTSLGGNVTITAGEIVNTGNISTSALRFRFLRRIRAQLADR